MEYEVLCEIINIHQKNIKGQFSIIVGDAPAEEEIKRSATEWAIKNVSKSCSGNITITGFGPIFIKKIEWQATSEDGVILAGNFLVWTPKRYLSVKPTEDDQHEV